MKNEKKNAKKIIIGERRKAPIATSIIFIAVGWFCFMVYTICFFIDPTTITDSPTVSIIFYCFVALIILFGIVGLVTRIKSWKNKKPIAIYDPKKKEFEFYSILVTSLTIKADKIYRIQTTLQGRIFVYFYSEINQKLVLNLGFAKDAKRVKNELKKYISQKIN